MSLITNLVSTPKTTQESNRRLNLFGYPALVEGARKTSYSDGLEIIANWLAKDCPTAASLRIRRDNHDEELDVAVLDSEGRIATSCSEFRDTFAAVLLDTHGETLIGLGSTMPQWTADDTDAEWFDVPVTAVLDEYECICGIRL